MDRWLVVLELDDGWVEAVTNYIKDVYEDEVAKVISISKLDEEALA